MIIKATVNGPRIIKVSCSGRAVPAEACGCFSAAAEIQVASQGQEPCRMVPEKQTIEDNVCFSGIHGRGTGAHHKRR